MITKVAEAAAPSASVTDAVFKQKPGKRAATASPAPFGVIGRRGVATRQASSGVTASISISPASLPAAARLVTSTTFGPRCSSVAAALRTSRSEERRVGTGCVSPCISRWSLYHLKQKQKKLHVYY